MSRILVLGLGNSVLRDDSVGLRVADGVEARLAAAPLPAGVDVAVDRDEAGGWDVLDHAEGFDALILVDASTLDALPPGELRWYPGRAFPSARVGGPHSTDMFTALEYGRSNGLRVPDEIHILGIGVEDVTTFSEECTPRVAAACTPATTQVLERIAEIVARRCP
jgi:hydrogenase maturation protease